MPNRKKTLPETGGDATYEILPDVDLVPEEAARAEAAIAQADKEHPALTWQSNFRLNGVAFVVVNNAAGLSGMPLQSYIRQAVVRAAMGDLRLAREGGIILPQIAAHL